MQMKDQKVEFTTNTHHRTNNGIKPEKMKAEKPYWGRRTDYLMKLHFSPQGRRESTEFRS